MEFRIQGLISLLRGPKLICLIPRQETFTLKTKKVQVNLDFKIFLSQSPEYWDYGLVPRVPSDSDSFFTVWNGDRQPNLQSPLCKLVGLKYKQT